MSGGPQVVIAPFAVVLAEDTELQPDILVARRMFDRMTRQTRTLVFTVLGSSATMAAVTISAARLG